MSISLENPIDHEWITINDKSYIETVLRTFGDDDKEKKLISLLHEPNISSDVLRKNSILQTSGYRKIKEMINDGMIITKSFIISDGRKFYIYVSVFKDLKIRIVKDKIIVKVKMNIGINIPLKNQFELNLGEQIAN